MILKKYKSDKPPRLKDYNGDLRKRWYIDYWVYNTDTQNFDKLRYWIPSDRTLEKRRLRVKEAMEEIRLIIEAGYMRGESSYELDKSFDLERLTVKEAIIYFLNYKHGTTSEYGTKKLIDPDEWNEDTARIKKDTWVNYKGIFEDFELFLKRNGKSGLLLKSVSTQMVRVFLEELKKKKLSNRRVNAFRTILSSLFNYFKNKEELNISNPFAKVEKLQQRDSEKHPPFTPEQLKQIVEYCEKRPNFHQLLLFIRFIYYTLARPYEEIRNLRIKDIGEKHIYIRSENHKSGISRKIDIPPALEEEIQKHKIREYPPDLYVFGNPVYGMKLESFPSALIRTEGSIYRQHKKLLAELGLEGYSLYGYKHTGAIALYKATKDIIKVRDMCGHTSVSTTEIYLRGLGAIENTVANVEKF